VALRSLFVRENNWSRQGVRRFALIFCFFLIKQKEDEKMIEFLRRLYLPKENLDDHTAQASHNT